ncbi:MAG TPA: protease pro-enzyme activation domain-containing protein [Acidobacteriaceae bacterium]|nr:protease pro-enzyme activation domain-containing protein [Acidobacteriaceae bacterium]
MLLQRSPAQQADLENLVARQQQPGTPEYHKWLTPAEFGARFGASPQDVATLSSWLESQGFRVRGVLKNSSMIDFEATAAQVREAFHSQLHYVNMRGGKYSAAIQDPQIPAALAPVVVGIKGLNKIPPLTNHTEPHPSSRDSATHSWQMIVPQTDDTVTPAFNAGGGYYVVSPQDLYTIYKVNPVFTSGNLGANATVAVIEETDIEYGTVNSGTGSATGGDIATFRSLFGVPGTLNMHVYHGFGSVTCSDPGIVANEDVEATLDAEWMNATAPSANLIFMSCDNTTNDGIFSSMAALIDNNLSDVMSLSYGESEQYYTASDYAFQDNLFAQAAAQGQSIVISSGDSGSDVRDQNTSTTATHGINVSAFAAPLVTVTGGTDFQDLYDTLEGGSPQSAYWSSTNSAAFGDALGYVPEMPWNDSCASSILAVYEGYTGAGLCATNSYTNGDVVGGSGGISTHYAVPSWQSGISGYSNSMHSQPDISGIAADGFWGHYLVFCDSNPSYSGSYDCSSSSNFGGAGGTSFVAPYMAGIFGLLRTATGSRQGLLNPALYALAKAQYTSPSTQTACYANGQTSNTGVTTGLPASTCIFNDVTTGNNDVPCASGRPNCYVNSGKTYGMLSLTGSSSLSVAYPSGVGYDQVTGIGTVNVANLIAGWNTAFASSTTLQANPTTISATQSTQLTATVSGGTPTGYVDAPPSVTGTITFKAGSTVVGTCTLSAGTCSTGVPGSSLQSGANSLTAIFGGSGTYPSSTSSVVTVTVQNSSPTPLTPWIQVNNGGWQQTNIVTVSPGSMVNLGEQVLTGGSYSWTGPGGYSSSSRIASNVPLTSTSNVFTLTYTNTVGATSTQSFTITVN